MTHRPAGGEPYIALTTMSSEKSWRYASVAR
ncbi:hypothetical protein STSP_42050 [Streptomyces jeddahensis]|uniref:Uncharacterized protein n=1 Tax=Streptomyces jeddahensis TaxID=1716141 RepID=A0A177HQ24_9ACTN|nr:hypothetical protein STSP_42050 [Streptomyces jeddahensis]